MMKKISGLKLEIFKTSNGGIFRDSRRDIKLLADCVNRLVGKVNDLIDENNKLNKKEMHIKNTDFSSVVFDLTDYREIQERFEKKTVLSACFRLDKKTIIQIISCEKILVNGEYYEVPEHYLLHLLINKQYGETKLELVKIN